MAAKLAAAGIPLRQHGQPAPLARNRAAQTRVRQHNALNDEATTLQAGDQRTFRLSNPARYGGYVRQAAPGTPPTPPSGCSAGHPPTKAPFRIRNGYFSCAIAARGPMEGLVRRA